jgi:hypothetical protein
MSRAFVKEDAEAFEELPDQHISPHPNHVTQQGLTHLEAMLNMAQEAHAAAVAAQDRAAMAHASRELRYYIASTLRQLSYYPARGRKGADLSNSRRR